ncbi:hypothetical protein ABZX90_04085 [Streptomyces sp. NPDC002935]|uniref:hypothetical protein n=1 Tax=Streptomyces sp. NPDC002935 TaxID=3154545 RepID=UPI0033B409B6
MVAGQQQDAGRYELPVGAVAGVTVQRDARPRVVLVVGTTLCLAFLATVTLPADITLFARALTRLAPATPPRGAWTPRRS